MIEEAKLFDDSQNNLRIHIAKGAFTDLGNDLSKSIYFKSCPSCSRWAGAFVFKKYPEEFGLSEARPGDGGQSWCLECRRLKENHDASHRQDNC
jgi:hypothetical protein